MIKISRISSPLKDKIKNVDLCSQLDGDGVFEGKYNTTGTVLLRNGYKGSLISDQTIVDNDGNFDGDMKFIEKVIAEKHIYFLSEYSVESYTGITMSLIFQDYNFSCS